MFIKKHFLKLLTLATVSLLNWGCDNELDLVEPGKEVPVVFGLINNSDSVTYIRVERTFVDANKSGIELAKVADSLYYANITVQLWRNSAPTQKFTLTRVNAALEGYPRSEGLFAQTPNYVYKVRNSVILPQANEVFTLSVTRNGETKPLTLATTSIVGAFESDTTTPQFGNPGIALTAENSLAFGFDAKDLGTPSADKSGYFADLTVVFNYDETDATGTKAKTLTWKFAQKVLRQGTLDRGITYSRKTADLLTFLAQNIDKKAGVTRRMKSLDAIYDMGGREIFEFQNVGAANAGITGSQSLPTYTNLSNNAFGVFSSRNQTIKRGYVFGQSAQSLFVNSPIMAGLNFR